MIANSIKPSLRLSTVWFFAHMPTQAFGRLSARPTNTLTHTLSGLTVQLETAAAYWEPNPERRRWGDDGGRHHTDGFENADHGEVEILHLVAPGATNQEIAAQLFLSAGTIRNYVSSIFSKLDVADRTQAAVIAVRHGLGR